MKAAAWCADSAATANVAEKAWSKSGVRKEKYERCKSLFLIYLRSLVFFPYASARDGNSNKK